MYQTGAVAAHQLFTAVYGLNHMPGIWLVSKYAAQNQTERGV